MLFNGFGVAKIVAVWLKYTHFVIQAVMLTSHNPSFYKDVRDKFGRQANITQKYLY